MRKYIKKAKRILHNCPNSQHVTFIVKRNTIICYGVNKKYKTAPLAKKFGHRFSAIHSELAAIKSFPYPIVQLPSFKIINVRIKKNGDVGLSKPCRHCQTMLWFFNIRQIYYSTNNGGFRKLII